jgi:hypothetical protein
VKRLELKQVRVCAKCGRGRAELESGDGDRLEVRLDAARAHELSGHPEDDLRTLSALVLEQLAASGARPGEVVLDVGPGGLRAMLSFSRGAESDLVACTAQEGVGLAVRGALPLYATDEALALDNADAGDPGPDRTVH